MIFCEQGNWDRSEPVFVARLTLSRGGRVEYLPGLGVAIRVLVRLLLGRLGDYRTPELQFRTLSPAAASHSLCFPCCIISSLAFMTVARAPRMNLEMAGLIAEQSPA